MMFVSAKNSYNEKQNNRMSPMVETKAVLINIKDIDKVEVNLRVNHNCYLFIQGLEVRFLTRILLIGL